MFNLYDVAPLAWASGGLAKIPALYGAEAKWLKDLIAPIASKVAPCGYQQIGVGKELRPKLDASKPLPWQITYQHLDGYLEAMGLLDEMSTLGTFLNPIPF